HAPAARPGDLVAQRGHVAQAEVHPLPRQRVDRVRGIAHHQHPARVPALAQLAPQREPGTAAGPPYLAQAVAGRGGSRVSGPLVRKGCQAVPWCGDAVRTCPTTPCWPYAWTAAPVPAMRRSGEAAPSAATTILAATAVPSSSRSTAASAPCSSASTRAGHDTCTP